MKRYLLKQLTMVLIVAMLLPMVSVAEFPDNDNMETSDIIIEADMEDPVPVESDEIDLPLDEEPIDETELAAENEPIQTDKEFATPAVDTENNTDPDDVAQDGDVIQDNASEIEVDKTTSEPVSGDSPLSDDDEKDEVSVDEEQADETTDESTQAMNEVLVVNPDETVTIEEAIAPVEIEYVENTQMKVVAEADAGMPAALVLGLKEKYQLTGGDGYTSSNPKVAAVTPAGLVTAKKKGSATITASSGATCQVTVKAAPKKITLPKKQTVVAGQSIILTAKVKGGASNTITWSSSNPAVATVDANGFVTAVSMGKAKITARTYNKKKATCTLTVDSANAPTSVSFPMGTLFVGKGENVTLKPVLNPGAETKFTYTAKNKKVAAVGKTTGVVKGKKVNKSTKITVTTQNKKKASLSVKVLKAPTDVTLSTSAMTLDQGGAAALSASLPAKMASQITWMSNNPGVATVSEGNPFSDGTSSAITITAVGGGIATITASTFNGKEASCQVTVNVPAPAPAPADTSTQPAPSTPVAASDAVKQLAADMGLSVDELVAKSGRSVAQLNAMNSTELAALKVSLTPVEANDAVKQLATELGLTVDELVTQSGKSVEELNAMSAEELATLKASLTPAPVEANAAVKQLAEELGLTVDALVTKSGKSVEELNAMSAEELATLKASLTPAPVEANAAVKQLAEELGLTVDAIVTKSGKTVEQLNAMSTNELAALKTALTPEKPVEPSDAVKQLATDLGLSIDDLVTKSGKTVEQLNALTDEELAALKTSLTPAPVEANAAVKQLAEELGLTVDALVTKSGKSMEELNAMRAEELATLKASLTPAQVEANAAVKQLAEELGLTVDALVTQSGKSAEELNAMSAEELATLKASLTPPVEASDAVKQLATELRLTVDELVAKSGKTIEQLNAMSAEELAALKEELSETQHVGDFVMNNGIVTGYTGKGGNITIPNKDYDEISIFAIGEKAFKDNATITRVLIPNIVKEIRASAFENCTQLEHVEISNGVKIIRSLAFANTALNAIFLPASIEIIDDRAFEGLVGLEIIADEGSYAYQWAVDHDYIKASIYPESSHPYAENTNEIWKYNNPRVGVALEISFSPLTDFENHYDFLTITDENGDSIKYTGSDLSGITLVLPGNSFTLHLESDESEERYGFAITRIKAYTEEEYSEYLEDLKNHPFITRQMPYDTAEVVGYRGMDSKVNIPSQIDDQIITGIGSKAFDGKNLTEVTISEGIISIQEAAFNDCTDLREVILPRSVTYISDNAFSGCPELKSIVAPEGSYAYEWAVNRGYIKENVILESLHPSFISYGNWKYSYDEIAAGLKVTFSVATQFNELTITESTGKRRTYNNKELSGQTIVVMGNSFDITMNCYYMFGFRITEIEPMNEEGLKEWKINNPFDTKELSDGTIEIIGYNGFDTNVTVPAVIKGKNVSAIGDCAFRDCNELISIILPSGIRKLENASFYGCSALKSISLPEGIDYIGSHAFNGCISLTEIDIPNSVSSIGYSAFNSCSNLRSINLPDGIVKLEYGIFGGCTNLESVELSNNLIKIEDSVFFGCTKLRAIKLPDNIETIGSDAFYDCSFTTIELPNSLNSIADTAFDYTPVRYMIADKGTYAYDWAVSHGFICPEITPESDFSYTINDDGTSTVTKYNGSWKIVNVPSEFGGHPLIEIKERAFSYSKVNEVIIPDGVTHIADHAFLGSNIAFISLPDSVGEIGVSAFEDCDKLETVSLPKSLTAISSGLFCSCSALINVDIPDSVITIDGYAFNYCDSLSSLKLPNSLVNIGKAAFGCGIVTLHIPKNVCSIDLCAFSHCTSLRELTVSNENEHFLIQDGALYNTQMTELYCVSVDKSGEYCIPSGIQEIGSAFSGCIKITSITIPDGVKNIRENTFYDCTGLGSVYIPDTVNRLGYNAFGGCSNLQGINIPDSVNTIEGSVFSGCSSLVSIKLPNNYRSGIENNTFNGCSSLQSIVIPENASIRWIGESAFKNCSSLTGIDIPEVGKFGYIGGHAFEGCSSMTSFTIPDGIAVIGECTFAECSALKSIVIPDSVSRIYPVAFKDCSSLKKIVLPDGITSIENGTFWGCKSLETIKLPGRIELIDIMSFQSCQSLNSIIIPDCVKTIGFQAFCDCKGLISIYIPDSVTNIVESAFALCSDNLVIYGVTGSYAETYAIENSILFKRKYTESDVNFSITHVLQGSVLDDGSKTGYFFMSPGAGANDTSTLNIASNYIWTVSASDTSWITVTKKSHNECLLTVTNVENGSAYSTTLTFVVGGIKKCTVDVKLDKTGQQDENRPTITSVVPSTTTAYTNVGINFDISTTNATTIKLVADNTWEFEYPATNDETIISRAFSLAGERVIQFSVSNGDGLWSAPSDPITLHIMSEDECSGIVIDDPISDGIVLNNAQRFTWAPVSTDVEIDHYNASLYIMKGEEWEQVGSTVDTGTNAYASFDSLLVQSGKYMLAVELVQAGSQSAVATGKLFFEYRTVPAFSFVSIDNTGLPGSDAVIKWNAPVWAADETQKPDKYIIWVYGPGIETGHAIELPGAVSEYEITSDVLALSGSYVVDVYAILGDGEQWQQTVAEGFNGFNLAERTITIDNKAGPYLATDEIHVTGKATGGIRYVRAQLEKNGGPDVVPLVGADGEAQDYFVVEVDTQTGEYYVKLEPAEAMSLDDSNAITVYGYASREEAEEGINYLKTSFLVLNVTGSTIYSRSIKSSLKTTYGYTWRYTNEQLHVEVVGNRAMESLSVTAGGNTVAQISSEDIANYRRKLTSDNFSFSSYGVYNVVISVDGATRTEHVYVVDGQTAETAYVSSDNAVLMSLPNEGKQMATIYHNEQVQVLGSYGDKIKLVRYSGQTGFIDTNKYELSSSMDKSIHWSLTVDNSSNPKLTVSATNVEALIGNTFVLLIGTDDKDKMIRYPNCTMTLSSVESANSWSWSLAQDLGLQRGHVYYFGVAMGHGLSQKTVEYPFGISAAIITPSQGEILDFFTSGRLSIEWGKTAGATSYTVELLTGNEVIYRNTVSTVSGDGYMENCIIRPETDGWIRSFTDAEKQSNTNVSIRITANIP